VYIELRNKLVDLLKEEGIIKSEKVERALRTVPRHEFVWPTMRDKAYYDMPLPLGNTGQTISAPHMVAIMNELLELDKGLKILEVGTGSGYHAATIAEIVAPSNESENCWGIVYSIEYLEELADFARSNLKRTGYSNRVHVVIGDGGLGLPEYSPFDRILVTAASPTIPPPLKQQLKVGGRIVIPIGTHLFSQELVVLEKKSGKEFDEKRWGGVAFVPLLGKFGGI